MSITPFKGASYTQEIVLQTAAQWEGTPDFYLQAYQVGRESDTGLAKSGPGLWGDLSYLAPKVYRALLTQSGTDAPVATVLENTLGGEVVWSYDGAGLYTATLAGAFTLGKTFVPQMILSYDPVLLIVGWSGGVNPLTLNTVPIGTLLVSGDGADGFLNETPFEILVYP